MAGRSHTEPVYVIDARGFSTVRGLIKYLMKKHGAQEVSGVSSDRTVRVYRSRDEVVATYRVDAPVVGKPMRVVLA